MATHSDAAPSEFAEAARSTFIYAPLAAVAGVALVAVGVGVDSGFPVILGVVANIAAVVVGLTGIAGMVRSGQQLLASRHEAAGLAIRHYREADTVAATAIAEPAVAQPPVAPQGTVPDRVVDPPDAGSAPANPADAEEPRDERVGDGGYGATTDQLDFVALLKSLYILDAARDVQRLYGNGVCASFVNRKCEDNNVRDVSLTAADIPAKF